MKRNHGGTENAAELFGASLCAFAPWRLELLRRSNRQGAKAQRIAEGIQQAFARLS